MTVRYANRSGDMRSERTLADLPRTEPVDSTPHAHFHAHGGSRHAHVHSHPDEHAHSARADEPAHEEAA